MNKLAKIAIGLSIFSIVLTLVCTYAIAMQIGGLRLSDDNFAHDIVKHDAEINNLQSRSQ